MQITVAKLSEEIDLHYDLEKLTPYEIWQLQRFGSYIPEGLGDDTEFYEEKIKEPIIEINEYDDFNFHPDWYYGF